MVEQLNEPVLEIAWAVVVIDLVFDVPVAPDTNQSVLDCECMTGQELLDPTEQRCLPDRVLEGQILGERLRVGGDLRQKRQQRLRLRGEYEQVTDDRVIEGFYSKAV